MKKLLNSALIAAASVLILTGCSKSETKKEEVKSETNITEEQIGKIVEDAVKNFMPEEGYNFNINQLMNVKYGDEDLKSTIDTNVQVDKKGTMFFDKKEVSNDETKEEKTYLVKENDVYKEYVLDGTNKKFVGSGIETLELVNSMKQILNYSSTGSAWLNKIENKKQILENNEILLSGDVVVSELVTSLDWILAKLNNGNEISSEELEVIKNSKISFSIKINKETKSITTMDINATNIIKSTLNQLYLKDPDVSKDEDTKKLIDEIIESTKWTIFIKNNGAVNEIKIS